MVVDDLLMCRAVTPHRVEALCASYHPASESRWCSLAIDADATTGAIELSFLVRHRENEGKEDKEGVACDQPLSIPRSFES